MAADEKCPTCGGSGLQPREPQPDSFGNYTPCDDCEGTGLLDFEADRPPTIADTYYRDLRDSSYPG